MGLTWGYEHERVIWVGWPGKVGKEEREKKEKIKLKI